MEKSKTFTQIIEHNEPEGESWSYWLQVEGNQEALNALFDAIEREGLEDEYEITEQTIYEWELEPVIRYGNFGYGYMQQHHKFSGKLTLPEDFHPNILYKGQIEGYFEV